MIPQSFTAEAFAALGNPTLVYVKPMKAAAALEQFRVPENQPVTLRPDQIVYAVHRADGEPLAILSDHDTAFAMARAHELAPVSVH